MPEFEDGARSDAPPEEVWKLLYDPSRFPDWWAGVGSVEPGQAGEYTMYPQGYPDFPMAQQLRVTESGVTISCLVSDLVFEWRLTMLDGGAATSITVHVEIPEAEAHRLAAQQDVISQSLSRLAALAAAESQLAKARLVHIARVREPAGCRARSPLRKQPLARRDHLPVPGPNRRLTCRATTRGAPFPRPWLRSGSGWTGSGPTAWQWSGLTGPRAAATGSTRSTTTAPSWPWTGSRACARPGRRRSTGSASRKARRPRLTDAQAARRRTSQTHPAMSSTDSASSQPLSIHWNGQNLLPG